MRLLFWVQHLLGTGHLRRALTLSGAFAARGHAVTLVSGGMPTSWPIDQHIRFEQLPPLRAADHGFSALVDEHGREAGGALMEQRRQRLLDLLAETRPDLIMTEMFPFGRGAFRGELLPLLEAARRMVPAPLVCCSLRDVLVGQADPAKTMRMAELARRHFDRVLVHGDAGVIPLEASFPMAGGIADLLCYTGYLTDAAVERPVAVRDEILVSAGGGAVGGPILRAALAAQALVADQRFRWRFVLGMNFARDEALKLQDKAAGGTIIDVHHDSLVPYLARAAVSVSQAGYNTVVEALATRTPMVLVPFGRGREDEQTRRAEVLAARGLAEIVNEPALTPDAIARAVERAMGLKLPATGITLDDGHRAVMAVERMQARTT